MDPLKSERLSNVKYVNVSECAKRSWLYFVKITLVYSLLSTIKKIQSKKSLLLLEIEVFFLAVVLLVVRLDKLCVLQHRCGAALGARVAHNPPGLHEVLGRAQVELEQLQSQHYELR